MNPVERIAFLYVSACIFSKASQAAYKEKLVFADPEEKEEEAPGFKAVPHDPEEQKNVVPGFKPILRRVGKVLRKTGKVIVFSAKNNYNREGCISKIALGVLFGVGRIFVYRFFVHVPITPMSTVKLIITCWLTFQSTLLAPIIEESLHRAPLIKRVERDGNIIKNICFSALLFGSMHAFGLKDPTFSGGIKRVFSSFLGGVVYGSLAVYTKDCWASTVAHGMFNCYNYLAEFF
jgi:membrane protease YdiL (CAAX protease family)